MKKILMIIFCAFAVLSASAQDKKLTLNAGFLFPNTLNAMIGYEHPLSYGNAVEIYGEVGNHWQEPTCCRFWKMRFNRRFHVLLTAPWTTARTPNSRSTFTRSLRSRVLN